MCTIFVVRYIYVPISLLDQVDKAFPRYMYSGNQLLFVHCQLCQRSQCIQITEKTIMPPYLRIKETSTLSIKRRRGLNVLVKNFKKCGTIYCILKKIIKSTLNFALKQAYYKNVSFQSSCSSFTCQILRAHRNILM